MTPMCLTKRGCHIADVAPSFALNRLVDAFIDMEILEMSPGYARFQERVLEESGLLQESTETILAMKSLMAEYRQFKQNKSK